MNAALLMIEEVFFLFTSTMKNAIQSIILYQMSETTDATHSRWWLIKCIRYPFKTGNDNNAAETHKNSNQTNYKIIELGNYRTKDRMVIKIYVWCVAPSNRPIYWLKHAQIIVLLVRVCVCCMWSVCVFLRSPSMRILLGNNCKIACGVQPRPAQ